MCLMYSEKCQYFTHVLQLYSRWFFVFMIYIFSSPFSIHRFIWLCLFCTYCSFLYAVSQHFTVLSLLLPFRLLISCLKTCLKLTEIHQTTEVKFFFSYEHDFSCLHDHMTLTDILTSTDICSAAEALRQIRLLSRVQNFCFTHFDHFQGWASHQTVKSVSCVPLFSWFEVCSRPCLVHFCLFLITQNWLKSFQCTFYN